MTRRFGASRNLCRRMVWQLCAVGAWVAWATIGWGQVEGEAAPAADAPGVVAPVPDDAKEARNADVAAEVPAAGTEAAADVPPDLGTAKLLSIRLPLTGDSDGQIKSTIDRAVDQLTRVPHRGDRRPLLILEIAPGRRQGGHGEDTDFERALSVARHLTSQRISAVKTVAYVPRTIKGHGVLMVLACEEIVMSPDAELGEAGIRDSERATVESSVVSAYQQIARARRTVPEAIVLGMLDRRREVLKVETDKGTEFVLRDELESLQRDHTIVSQETLIPAGALGSFSGREGREFGFVKLLAADRATLARGLAVPAEAVMEDQSLVGNWRPVMLNIDGPIEPRTVRQIEKLLGSELRTNRVNWIGIQIDSTGGPLEECLRLANTIAELDANEVQKVAYVPAEASGGAALIALACDQVVMHPEAHLGGQGTVEAERAVLDAAVVSIRDSLAGSSNHNWSLLAALIDPDIELFTYQNIKTGEVRHFSSTEVAEQENPDDWRKGARIKPAGEPLRLAARRAQELEIASNVVDSFDQFKQLYGFETDPRIAKPNWALELVEALSSPALAVLLLVIGCVGIYIELHSPGVGIGAFVAALAFLLFFWSNFLHGTAGWLEVLLFLGGIAFLLLELLVLPGVGVFGLGGGAMILVSLVLASQTFVFPQTELQRAEMRHSLTIVAAATVCVVAAAMVLRHYLPHAPVFRKLLLNPTPEEELAELEYREALADFSHLVGQQGTTATNLMPAGKADFGGQLVDVIADGLPIERGQPVVVVKARGSRVVVRRAEAWP